MFVAGRWREVARRFEPGKNRPTFARDAATIGGVRILIVEDDVRLSRLLARRLQAEGYEVETCGNGSEAVDLAASDGWDVLVFDVMLPGLDGISLTQELRGRHNLEGAFTRRAITERAKGILMERHGIDEEAAFNMLRDQARRTNRKLVDLADAVVSGHPLLPSRSRDSEEVSET